MTGVFAGDDHPNLGQGEGLIGMRVRASLLGGRLQVSSTAGNSTRIPIEVQA